MELLQCIDPEQSKIIKKYRGRDVTILFGGLDGTVRYYGVGLTPLGKEPEAAVGRMMASRKSVGGGVDWGVDGGGVDS